MKKIIVGIFVLINLALLLLLSLIIIGAVYGEEVPPALKDAVITVNLKDGKKATFSANQWKVVPRIDKPAEKSKPAEQTSSSESSLNNRVRILGGVGPQGFHLNQDTSKINVSDRNKIVFGLGYDRRIYKRLSIGGEAISNGTYLLNLGLDF